MRKIQNGLSIVIAFTVLFTFVQCMGGKDTKVERFMKSQAKEVNRTCPMDMGNGVTLLGCTVEEDRTFEYNYEVNDKIAERLNLPSLKPLMVGALKNLPSFEKIKEYEISFLYAYYDSDGELLDTLKIIPEDYEEN